jgi:hypothetical protein
MGKVAKKTKLDSKTRNFNNDWTMKYLFILPNVPDLKPMCVLCTECVSAVKEYNMKRHFTTKHGDFGISYPEGSVVRKAKVESLITSYKRGSAILVQSCTQQEKATAASLHVSWILAKKKKPFSDSETVKECILAVLEEIVSDEKMKKSITSSVQQIPMSDTSTIRRIEILGTEVFESLITDIKQVEFLSIAIDESTDNTDVAQLCVYVRFFNGKCFREEMLALIPLANYTTGEVISEKIKFFFQENGLDLTKICLLATDGAPSMLGKHQGVTARLAALAPQMQSLHCLIHQSVLCSKLSNDLKETMTIVMAIINFIRSTSSLQHRLFQQLLEETSADCKDLLLHNDVRWLSKGKALDRFWCLKDEIIVFLRNCLHKKAEKYRIVLEDNEFLAKVCFLVDIFAHLNALNLQLQGRDKTIIDLVEKLSAFREKLPLFLTDLQSAKLLHFTNLKKFIALTSGSATITNVMIEFLNNLHTNFTDRFEDFNIPNNVMLFVRDPFKISPASDFSSNAKKLLSSVDEGSLQLELVDIQCSSSLKENFQESGTCKFWSEIIQKEQFPNAKKVAIYLLTMFGSTYTCESSFSHMNVIKSNTRSSMCNDRLQDCMRIALTSYQPNFINVAKKSKCHFSH